MKQSSAEQDDGVNQCLSSFSVYASLQSVENNFMPDHRNGCRAWRHGAARLAGRGVLAERGIQGTCSQTLKDAKIQILSFIIQQLTRNECYKGLAFSLKYCFFQI